MQPKTHGCTHRSINNYIQTQKHRNINVNQQKRRHSTYLLLLLLFSHFCFHSLRGSPIAVSEVSGEDMTQNLTQDHFRICFVVVFAFWGVLCCKPFPPRHSRVISRTAVTMESISSFEDGFWCFGVFRKKMSSYAPPKIVG